MNAQKSQRTPRGKADSTKTQRGDLDTKKPEQKKPSLIDEDPDDEVRPAAPDQR